MEYNLYLGQTLIKPCTLLESRLMADGWKSLVLMDSVVKPLFA